MNPVRCSRLAAVALVLLVVGRVDAAPLFADADASTLVVRGTVEGITRYPEAKLQVFHLRVGRVLKGDVADGEAMDLAQEMLFAATKPYFTTGTETLIFAVPLPAYTSFTKVLPAGRYWRWTQRLETAADVAPLTDRSLTDAVGRYLAVRDDTEALADFVVQSLVGADARLRREALQVIAGRRELVPLLDAGRLQPLGPWLHGSASPVERAQVLVQLARRKAPGVGDLARGLADEPGPMQAPAIDALIAVGEPPPVARLLALSRSPDDALRLVAGRGLARLGTPEAVTRVGEILEAEKTTSVRIGIIQGFGHTSDPRVTDMLAREIARPEKDVVMAAAEGLVQQGSPEAIAVLVEDARAGKRRRADGGGLRAQTDQPPRDDRGARESRTVVSRPDGAPTVQARPRRVPARALSRARSPRAKRVRGLALILLITGLLHGGPAFGHQQGISYTDVEIANGRVRFDLMLSVHDLAADVDGDGTTTDAEIRSRYPRLRRRFENALVVEAGGTPCPLTLEASGLEPNEMARFRLTGPCPDLTPVRVVVRLPVLSAVDGQNLAKIRAAGVLVEHVFTPTDQEVELGAASGGLAPTFRRFFALGVEHIATGYDHILFLFALLLVGGGLRGLLAVVTAFTVAHSVTLSLAVLGVVRLPSRLVESAIALSIAWVALENLLLDRSEGRWRITFAFGLMHGFGFASVLREMHLPREGLVASLLAFNLGVEAGQLVVVLLTYPLIAVIERSAHRRAVVAVASAGILVIALWWFSERAFG